MRYTSSHIEELASKGIAFLENHKKGIVYLECDGMNDLEISLSVAPSKKIKGFLIDGNFCQEDLSIEIVIVFNPDSERDLYWMNWSINEVLAHEICHYHQWLSGRLPKRGNRDLSPFKYYTQPHEVEAQIEGWKRVSGITGDSMERSAEIWFERNSIFHGMEEREWKKLIQKVFFLRERLVL